MNIEEIRRQAEEAERFLKICAGCGAEGGRREIVNGHHRMCRRCADLAATTGRTPNGRTW